MIITFNNYPVTFNGVKLSISDAFTPLSLEPLLWLDGADDSTISYVSGTDVNGWNDKSGNDYHYTQNTAGRYPTRITNGVQFNASKFLDRNTFWTNNDRGAREIIAVVKKNSVTNPNQQPFDNLFFQLNTYINTTTGCHFRPTAEGYLRMNGVAARSNLYIAQNETGIVGFRHKLNATYGDVKIMKNGIEYTPNIYVPSSTQDIIPLVDANSKSLVGNGEYLNNYPYINSNYFNGNIYELLFFNKELSTEERANLTSWLNTKWNIY